MATTSQAETSHVDAKLLQYEKQVDGMLADGKTYEAMHMIFTLANRFATRKNYTHALALTHRCALAFFAKGEASLGAQIATHYLEVLEKRGIPCTAEEITSIKKLLTSYPSTGNTDIAMKFMKKAIAFERTASSSSSTSSPTAATTTTTTTTDSSVQVTSKGKKQPPHPQLSHCLASFLFKRKQFPQAHAHYLHANAPAEHSMMLFQWAAGSPTDETDLYFVRSAIQYLCLRHISCATKVMSLFKMKYNNTLPQVVNTPLVHFVDFILEAINTAATSASSSSSSTSPTASSSAIPKCSSAIYYGLKATYSPTWNRDPDLTPLIARVGEIYFGVPTQKSLIASLFEDDDESGDNQGKAGMGTNTNNSYPQTTTTSISSSTNSTSAPTVTPATTSTASMAPTPAPTYNSSVPDAMDVE